MHLSNLPENLAFFSGAIDAAGSFGGIYQSAVLAYGSDLIKDPPDASRFADLTALQALEKSGIFKEQKVAIAPIRIGGGASLEADPLLSKDIRFLFEPNSSTLDMSNQENLKNLEAIKKLLQVSPGSTLLLRGHVDNAHGRRVPQAGRRGATCARRRCARWSSARTARARSASCSSNATTSTPKRIEIVGRGWEEPVRPEFGSEPPRRSAVVHARVAHASTLCPTSTPSSIAGTVKPDGITRREMLQRSLGAAAALLMSDSLLSAQRRGARPRRRRRRRLQRPGRGLRAVEGGL